MSEQNLLHHEQHVHPNTTDEVVGASSKRARSEASLAWVDPAEWDIAEPLWSSQSNVSILSADTTVPPASSAGHEELVSEHRSDPSSAASEQETLLPGPVALVAEPTETPSHPVARSGYRLAQAPEEESHKKRRKRQRHGHPEPGTQPNAITIPQPKRRRRHGRARDSRPLTSRPWFIFTSLLLCIGAAVYAGFWIYQLDANRSRTLKPGSGAAAKGTSVMSKLPTPEEQRQAAALIDEALAARAVGEIDRAYEVFKKIQSAYPWVRGIALETVVMLLPAKRSAEALAFANTSIQSGQDLAAGHVAVGLIAQNEGKLDSALMAFETAHHIDPCNADILFYWSEALREMGRSAEALKKLEAAIARSASESSLYLFNLKHRLAQLEVDGLKIDGDTVQRVLDASNLPAEEYLMAAALTLEAKEIPATVELLTRAGTRLPPTFFRFLLNDPVFSTAPNYPEIVHAVSNVIGHATRNMTGHTP
jgi:tetratricopeptide (TPR) repeat protein